MSLLPNQFLGLLKFYKNENFLDALIDGTFHCTPPEIYRLSYEKGVSDKFESHQHSGISFVTPHERHYGKDRGILKVRRETYQAAYEARPDRWSRGPKTWERKEVVYINPVEENLNTKLAS